MIPDYLTFIRFQDKRNLIYIYAIGLILIGFYWKNAGFTFPSEDIGVVSGILGNDSNLLIVFYVQIMPDDFVMQLHRF